MKQINIAEAKASLSSCLARVEAGETILIARHNEPIAELRPVRKTRKVPRPIGLCEGEFIVPKKFNAPLPDEVLRAFEGR